MSLRAIIIDFNSYFSSVEQQVQPELRGQPVVVAPVEAESTCAIAASYEAKRFGVKTGTRISDARRMCPGLIVVGARPELYIQFHHRLVEVVDSCLPVGNVMSIDEMCCALRGPWQERELALRTAREIKKRIAERVGPCLKSSIGIAPNPFLAKVASDMQKPDGLTVIETQDLPHALFPLRLRDFCGIGPNMEERLHRHEIYTVEQLCTAPKKKLREVWNGIEGERYHAMLRGEDVDRPPTQRSTVGHSHVLEPENRTQARAEAVLHRLLQKAAARLRGLGYIAGELSVHVRFLEGASWSRSLRLQETHDTLDFIRAFTQIWAHYPPGAPPPLKVGVSFFNLTAATNQTLPLAALKPDRAPLHRALDKLNEHYGKNTVYFGGAQTALASAPTRIAFTNVPQPEKERAKITPLAA